MSAASRGAALIMLAFLFVSPAARADNGKFVEAKTYFNAGAEAFDAGQFLAAVQAFEQAYRLVPKPAIVFSIAQSYRRQFYVDRKPERASRAIVYYRQYLAQVPKGGRRSDATLALLELEPLADRADASSAAVPLPLDARTRVMVSATHAEQARISLDGGEAVDSPLIEEVQPGKHQVEINAPGYLPEQREVVAVEGALVAVEARLREKPGRLLVTGPKGAEVLLDGRVVATLPLAAPLEVPAGRHWLVVNLGGHVPFARAVQVERDQAKAVDAALPTSTQRKLAHTTWIASGVGTLTGAVLGGLALSAQSEARDIEDDRRQGNISQAQADTHDSAVERRDAMRRGAVIAFSASAVLAASGLVLYLSDHPAPPVAPVSDDAAPRSPRAPRPPQVELSLQPFVGPNVYGLSFAGML